MPRFKIVFLDGKEIVVKALNFSTAYITAASSRVKAGDASAMQLLINEKACSVVTKKRGKNS